MRRGPPAGVRVEDSETDAEAVWIGFPAVLVPAIGIGETVVACHSKNALITPYLASLRGLK
jgi:hypothetical protein